MLKAKENCPLNGFQPCKQFECCFYIGLRGQCKNTGEEIDKYGCAVAFLPVLLIEGASESRQTGAAVESFRNVMVEANEKTAALLARPMLGVAL